MRIISEGSPQVERQALCRNCGTTIGFYPVDVKTVKEYDYTGDFDFSKVIKCPKCSKAVRVN